MAKQKWPNDDPLRKQYSKCWYQPLTDRNEAKLGLYFTLSQPVTAAIPPGEESLFRLALDLAMGFRPISQQEKEALQQMARDLNPVFTHPDKRRPLGVDGVAKVGSRPTRQDTLRPDKRVG